MMFIGFHGFREEATVIGKVDDDLEMIISNSGHEERHFRAFYGVGIGLSSFLAPWHMLPAARRATPCL